jgi:hypothetical protein
MRRSSLLSCAALCICLLSMGLEARADIINWSFDWTHTPAVVAADKGGTGGISLTNHQGGMGSGNSDIVATEITTFSAATVNAPDHFTNTPYSLILDLTDTASHQSGMLTFKGLFNGTLSITSANIKNTFISPLTQHLDLGGHLYSVTIGPYAAPGIPDATQTGSISAHVMVQSDGSGGGGTSGNPPPPPPPPTHGAPEPSSWVLATIGLAVLALVASWRIARAKHAVCA